MMFAWIIWIRASCVRYGGVFTRQLDRCFFDDHRHAVVVAIGSIPDVRRSMRDSGPGRCGCRRISNHADISQRRFVDGQLARRYHPEKFRNQRQLILVLAANGVDHVACERFERLPCCVVVAAMAVASSSVRVQTTVVGRDRTLLANLIDWYTVKAGRWRWRR